MSEVICPNCGQTSRSLVPLDGETRSRLEESGSEAPSEVCSNCLIQLSGRGQGSVLLAREKAKEQKKLSLWKSRVNLIRKARQEMTDKAFSDAAVSYEKYIKVLEMVFESEAGGLTPEHFKDSARTQELTIVASVYWDLLRIYDTSEKYGDRQFLAGKKLSQFLRFTPIYPDIIRKAQIFQKSAKNPNAIQDFLGSASTEKSGCFIASSAFESTLASEVLCLQSYRDQYLSRFWLGRLFIFLYYRLSPGLAKILDLFPRFKPLVRRLIRLFIHLAVRQ